MQQSADCEEGLVISNDNTVKLLGSVLQKYQQKVILISSRQKASAFEEKFGNIPHIKGNYNLSELDEGSQKLILERSVNFQAPNVALSTLVGTDPPDSIKSLLDWT